MRSVSSTAASDAPRIGFNLAQERAQAHSLSTRLATDMSPSSRASRRRFQPRARGSRHNLGTALPATTPSRHDRFGRRHAATG